MKRLRRAFANARRAVEWLEQNDPGERSTQARRRRLDELTAVQAQSVGGMESQIAPRRRMLDTAAQALADKPENVHARLEYLRMSYNVAAAICAASTLGDARLSKVHEVVDRALDLAETTDAAPDRVDEISFRLRYMRCLALAYSRDQDRGPKELRALGARARDGEAFEHYLVFDACVEYCHSLEAGGAERSALRSIHVEALDALERAVDLGFDDLENLRSVEAAAVVAGDPRFELLVQRMDDR